MDTRTRRMLDVLGGDPATVRMVRAPGRVNLIGDHTDYNRGWCLPMAIDRECRVAVRVRDADRVRATSFDVAGSVEFAVGSGVAAGVEPAWGRFVAGAVQGALRDGTGADVVVASTVPPGSGLSSSAALCVALVVAFGADLGDPVRVAESARQAELLATGVRVGLMDQLASILGQAGAALFLDCDRLEAEPVALPPTAAVGVVHSGLPRAVAASAYAERRSACEAAARRLGLDTLRDATVDQVGDDPVARHVVMENRRVHAAAGALREGDLETLGALLVQSHASLRDDFAVSTPELDLLVELLVDEGAFGARLTGAGFGGCVVALTRPEDRARVLGRASERYRERTGRVGTPLVVEPVDGAGPFPLS
jgi:galactokinase